MFSKISLLAVFTTWLLVFCSAKLGLDEEIQQIALPSQVKLNMLHRAHSDADKIRQFELLLNSEGFLRYRRTYSNGKQEYYPFNLMRIKAIFFRKQYLCDIGQFSPFLRSISGKKSRSMSNYE
ncbi:MAG: hypothetical protein ACOYKR_13785 [Sphingobacterium thalpophilum]